MQSKATTVREYLASLPADRREIIEAVRKVIRGNLDPAIEEGMSYGMIGYVVSRSAYPPGYHCNPQQLLPYAGLASQKQGISLYMMSLHCGCVGDEDNAESRRFKDAWTKAGKKLDMGKACIRFKRLEDVPLDVVAQAIRRMPAQKYIETYERLLAEQGIVHKGTRAPAKPATPAPKNATKKLATSARTTKKSAKKKAATRSPKPRA